MQNKEQALIKPTSIEIIELDDCALESVTGGMMIAPDVDANNCSCGNNCSC